jgi:hypothetical protein
VTDDELLASLAGALREEDQERARLEAEPVDEATLERAVGRMQGEPTASRPSGVVALRRSSRRRSILAATVVTAAAAAAAILLFVVRARDPRLPPYAVALIAGGTREEGALESPESPGLVSTIRVRQGGTLDVVARPASRVGGRVEARALLVHDGHASSWNADIEVTSEGSVRARGTLGEQLPLTAGTWTLAIVVAPAGSLPRDSMELASRGTAGAAGEPWRIARVKLSAQPGP